jgi:hypothetical protein
MQRVRTRRISPGYPWNHKNRRALLVIMPEAAMKGR